MATFGRAASSRGIRALSEWDDAEVHRAPICPYCGVTALPADPANVVDTRFSCQNADCPAFGEPLEAGS